ncbi:MAG: transposase [candidate division Zixibacteria bacterium]|nr:transposase [candidate division Zixibacteria bacterium]
MPNKLGNCYGSIMKAIKNIRLKHYDYSQNGYYFVTVCTNYRRHYLAKLNSKICNAVKKLNEIEGVVIDYYSILPTHVHLIIVLNESKIHIGEIVRRFKASSSKEAGIKLWQPNYYEHVIRNERALFKIREYIINNPLKEKIEFKQFYKP